MPSVLSASERRVKSSLPTNDGDELASTTNTRRLTDVTDLSDSSSFATPRLSDLSGKVVQAAAGSKRINREVPSLARLRLSNMRLHGREGDMKLLKNKLRDLAKKEKGAALPEIVLVSGVSGTGKSALVSRGLRDPAQKMGLTFCAGKFDLNATALPLLAFSDAISSLTKYVMAHENVQKIKDDIQEGFEEDDINLLVRAMPGCAELFTVQKQERVSTARVSFVQKGDSKARVSMQNGKEAIKRQQFAITRLMKIVCTNLKGVVLFIDDLQWTDTATLDLLKAISLDEHIPSLLLVGAYREDEVPDSHPLALQIREIEHMGIEITAIKIGNLSSCNVKSLVAEALGMEDEEDKVDALSTTVYKKTEGNAFFVLIFLRSLYDDELLKYNFGVMRWMWDDDTVNEKVVTENVATIMVNKLRRLKKVNQHIIKIASCLGASFSASILATVSKTVSDDTDTTSDDDDTDAMSVVSRTATEFEEEGLWERECEDICRFSHDKVQAAAFELIPSEKRNSFRGEIGEALMKHLDPASLEDVLFEAVSLRNCAIPDPEEERHTLALMNLEAGLKASSASAFDTAVIYFKAGHELLGSSGWEKDCTTMLRLCSNYANAAFINSDLETMNLLIDEVLSKKQLSVKDKFKVYEVRILASAGAGNFSKALDTALLVRRELGLSSLQNKPVPTVTILKNFIKTTRVVNNRTPEEIASLPELTDERIIMGQRMHETLLESTFLCQPTMYPLIGFQLVRTSIKYGINASSSDGFAVFGILLCHVFGKIKRGVEMGKAAELILANPDMQAERKRMKSRISFGVYGFISFFTAPVQETLPPLLHGYQVGLETGDVGSACYNLTWRACHLWFSGRPLDELETELETSVAVLERLNQVVQRRLVLVHLLAVKKLRGVCVEGEKMSFEAMTKIATDTWNPVNRTKCNLVQLELLAIDQDWTTAASLLVEAGDLRSNLLDASHLRFVFMEALISLKRAQATPGWLEKRKWKKKGLKAVKQIRGWVKDGNVNVVHFLHLLTAICGVLEGNRKKVEEHFKSAIAVASKNGFVHDRALAHELASAFFSDEGEVYWQNYHLEQAKKSYSDWGATEKVKRFGKHEE